MNLPRGMESVMVISFIKFREDRFNLSRNYDYILVLYQIEKGVA